MGRLTTEEDFNNLIIKEDGDNIVRFSDVGYAKLGAENDRTILRRDGVPGCAVAIVAQPGANNIDISERLKVKLAQIQRDLPPDVSYQMSFDSTDYIRASISEVEETIIIAFCLVLAIIFLFLRDWRTTLIPVATIPISSDRGLLRHVLAWLHHQCTYTSGYCAGHWSCGGRCYCGVGKHLCKN